jgi:glutaminyl-tRNA synthetase
VVAKGARVEPSLAEAAPGTRWQFLRQGYFFVDPVDSRPGAPVFNRTISLKDTWARQVAAGEARSGEKKDARAAPRRQPAGEAAGGGEARRSRAELRAEARASNPELAERYARYTGALALSEDEADLLSGDRSLATYFDAAVAVHPNASRWRAGS